MSQQYRTRHIQFRETIHTAGWQIKVYTISLADTFDAPIFYKNVLAKLPDWLAMENSFNAKHEKVGFLILHPATEGIFSILNWWVGKNMLNTHVFLTEHQKNDQFNLISGDGLGCCIWELEVMHHESLAWRTHILKKEPAPDYERYVEATFSKKF